ncbi:MAG: 5'-Nucleotidase domain protein, partial [Bacteroidetes bacterium]|nr:5'-Nucleotidase domain protein [Bacteroidota bacterium]
PLARVKVTATDVPAWLRFIEKEQRIALLKSEQEMAVTFTFSVDKTAPVQKNETLKFVITAPTGEKWTKEITVAVAAPDKFEMFQNYPNPFNPSTAISYQLPAPSARQTASGLGVEGSAVSRVSLKIYNLLGQEVASLVDGDRLAGYHQEMWDATRYASGVYVYQLIATDERGSKQVARKRMLLLK